MKQEEVKTFDLALALPSEARTGRDLLTFCISKNAVEQMSCKLYIAGFVHGMQASDDLQGEICVPKTLTGNDAIAVFTETMADIEMAAALGKGVGPNANPFFTGPQNAALALALAMKFKCPKKIARSPNKPFAKP
ncbi:MAG TPA: Rap1a/Tai family immunity protein [Steroidobacteraceae bacterium]